ncbi:glycosyl hydrolase [Histomonas meleagridis]|uniref:glycosyl hydrolase n=1 Tax=Histomonas meleagridis TaxID=135588 RepID=UPI00355A6C5A|nr:glycosyl hydrolase [Histomonas meleagridis]KAH0797087.1 glycosyl hydrolase [Histomonas meleagridis]
MLPFAFLLRFIASVNRLRFRTCQQSPFCSRNRYLEKQNWYFISDSIKTKNGVFEGIIYDGTYNNKLNLFIYFLSCGSIRVRIDPNDKEKFPRFDCGKEPTILNQEELEKHVNFNVQKENDKAILKTEELTVEVNFKPFSIVVFEKGVKKITLNAEDNAIFETHRSKKDHPKLFESNSFNGFTDTFKNGPTSVGMNFDFHTPGIRFSGLPSHTLPMTLPNTYKVTDPIRLFNTDINKYEVNSVMAMYGCIPFLMGHSLTGCDCVFWGNPSDTWIDVTTEGSKRVRFLSEGGYIDTFIFFGTPQKVVDIFTQLTGKPQLAPLFSLGFHQCRWGYTTLEEVLEVDSNLDKSLVPHDVMWLDLDHTNDRRYFTFHPTNFRDPKRLFDALDHNKRHLTILVDPHIRVEDSYIIYREAASKGLLIKSSDGRNDFIGKCWPGKSVWADYLNPKARSWWETNFDFKKFKDNALNLHIWNDMNEISVFESSENTAPRDLIHYGGYEEREVHNIYGLLMVSATYGGLVKRDQEHNRRPFILTRAFFAGAQKYSFVWTGDNLASWDQLACSIQMIISYGISSHVYVGADVGGFFNSPNTNLLSRWYNVGAWLYPFFRVHCHHLTNRREIYLLKDESFDVARDGIINRYKLILYWYSLARNANLTGEPLVRPLWWEFNEERFLDTDDKVMLGKSLLIVPFLSEIPQKTTVNLPNGRWYYYESLKEIKGKNVDVKDDSGRTAVFIRGGSIIPIKGRIRKSTELMFWDPLTLIIALDENEEAEGNIYVDDGLSFDFAKGNYLDKKLKFTNGKLNSYFADNVSPKSDFVAKYDVIIEKIIITGMKKIPSKINVGEDSLEFVTSDGIVTIHNPKVKVKDDFEIKFL